MVTGTSFEELRGRGEAECVLLPRPPPRPQRCPRALPPLSPVQHDHNRGAVGTHQRHRVQVVLLTGRQPHSLGAFWNELAGVGTGT